MKFFEKKQEEENFDSFPPIGGLMVSKMVTDQNIKPRFMYREKRTRRKIAAGGFLQVLKQTII